MFLCASLLHVVVHRTPKQSHTIVLLMRMMLLVWFRFVSFHPVLVRPWPIPRFILFSNIIIIVLAPLYTILLSAHADDLILYYLPAVKSHI